MLGMTTNLEIFTYPSVLGIYIVCLFVLEFYISPITKVIWRRDFSLKSHPKD